MKLHDFFTADGPVRYEPQLEGMEVRDDGVLLLGDRAGCGRSPSDLAHEMGHFAEIDDARMLISGWGLIFPQVVIANQLCDEPKTMKMTERELRVMAYQTNLLEDAGIAFNTLEIVRSLALVPDFFFVPLEDGRPAYLAEDVPYRDREPSKFRWLRNRVEALRAEFTLDRFRHEWNRRTKILGS